jgi:hypothetical protein
MSNISFDWRPHTTSNYSHYDAKNLDPEGFFERHSFDQLAIEMLPDEYLKQSPTWPQLNKENQCQNKPLTVKGYKKKKVLVRTHIKNFLN